MLRYGDKFFLRLMSLLFLLLFLLVLLSANVYFLWHIGCLLPLPLGMKVGVLVVLSVVALSVAVFYLFQGKDWQWTWAVATYQVGNSWLFILLYGTLTFLVLDLLRCIGWLPRHWLEHNVVTTLVLCVSFLLLFAYANYRFHDKQRVALTIATPKAITRPLRLVLLSDIHAGFHIRRDEIARMVDQINAEAPDYVLIAGDVIDISVRPLLQENVAAEFRRLQAPVYAVLGNHEYLAGDTAAQRFYADARIRLLQDSIVRLPEGLTLIGRDDRMNPHRKNLQRLLKEYASQISPTTGGQSEKPLSDTFLLLLDHQPYHLEQAQQAGIDFQFSGHTHRGQMLPISWLTDMIYEQSWGHYQKGATQYYISSGYGIWGAKFRLGTQSEYLVLQLQPISNTAL